MIIRDNGPYTWCKIAPGIVYVTFSELRKLQHKYDSLKSRLITIWAVQHWFRANGVNLPNIARQIAE
jgi:hypothetical protein